MPNYNQTLQTNNSSLEEIITQLNNMPEAGGVDLPTLSNPASASDILASKEAIDKDGNKITGTIVTKTSSNLTASGATVTVPAGYYASNATKSVASVTRAETTISVTKDDTNDKLTLTASNNQGTGYVTGANKTATKTVTLTTSGATATMSDGTNSVSKSITSGSAKTPATTVTKNPTITVSSSGLITASVSGTQSVTPTVSAGYVSSGTAGTITVSGSATKQLTTQAAKTITPNTSSQTAVASGRYTTGAVTVAAIPSNYEDVTDETTEYTNKLASLETAITALETELQGKASGGSGDGLQTASVYVNGANGTIFNYVGVSGLTTVTNPTETIQIVVPSICYATPADNTYLVGPSTSGACTITYNNYAIITISVVGDGNILVPSVGNNGGSSN